MAIANAEKLNNDYISRSYATLELKVSSLTQRFLGKIEGISRISETSRFRASYAKLAEEFNCSARHAIRIIKYLKDKKYITQDYTRENACASYRDNRLDDGRGFVRTAPFLKGEIFTFTYKNEETDEKYTYTRALSDIEIDVLSLMASHGTFEGTVRKTAKMLGKSPASVQKAIDALLHCEAIHRNGEGKSKSRRDKSVYHVDGELLRRIKKSFIKPKKSVESLPVVTGNGSAPAVAVALPKNPAIVDAEARATWERYYSILREKAIRRVESVEAELNADKEYRVAQAFIKSSTPKIARLELDEDWKGLRKLRKEVNEQKAIQARIIRDLGYSPADLIPQPRCRLCKDTGFKKNGVMCSCYPKEQN